MSSAGSEVAAVLVVMVLVGLVTCPLAFFADAQVTANGAAPVNPCAAQIAAKATDAVADQVQVNSTTGVQDTLDVYTGRDGGTVERVSAPLSVENGVLAPNECLGTVVSDLVRSDGATIPGNQVTSWALTGNAGLRIFIYIEVSPRYGQVTPAGGYTGTVSMDDERAVGGNIPVNIHVEYPRLWRASMVCIAAAWFGFFWAWLIHLTRADVPTSGRFWLYVILQLAILTIVSFPVLNAQILTNPDWTGDLSKYIALASLAGGGALATTPTLRALVDRAAIFMPGASPGPSPETTAPGEDTAPQADASAPAADGSAAPSTNGNPPSSPDSTAPPDSTSPPDDATPPNDTSAPGNATPPGDASAPGDATPDETQPVPAGDAPSSSPAGIVLGGPVPPAGGSVN